MLYRAEFMAEILQYKKEQLDEMGANRRDGIKKNGYAIIGKLLLFTDYWN